MSKIPAGALLTNRTYYILCGASGFAWAAAIQTTLLAFFSGSWSIINFFLLAWASLVQGGIILYYHSAHRGSFSLSKGLAVTGCSAAATIGTVWLLTALSV